MVFIDMHVHSNHSDGSSSVKNLINVAKKLKTGISITDHNLISGSVEACKDKKALVIPGIEIGAYQFKHFLLYFYDINELKEFYEKEIFPYRIKHRFDLYRTKIPLSRLIDLSKDYNCISSAAHPSIKTLKWNIKSLSKVDAIEVINSCIESKYNVKSFKLADRLQKPMTAGSDAHSMKHLNFAGIITNENTIENILHAVKRKQIQVTGSSYSTKQKLRHFLITSKSVLRIKKT